MTAMTAFVERTRRSNAKGSAGSIGADRPCRVNLTLPPHPGTRNEVGVYTHAAATQPARRLAVVRESASSAIRTHLSLAPAFGSPVGSSRQAVSRLSLRRNAPVAVATARRGRPDGAHRGQGHGAIAATMRPPQAAPRQHAPGRRMGSEASERAAVTASLGAREFIRAPRMPTAVGGVQEVTVAERNGHTPVVCENHGSGGSHPAQWRPRSTVESLGRSVGGSRRAECSCVSLRPCARCAWRGAGASGTWARCSDGGRSLAPEAEVVFASVTALSPPDRRGGRGARGAR
jgi:hypothetical protein